jgi:hypothetical protein
MNYKKLTAFAFFFSIIAIQSMVLSAKTKNETETLRNGAEANSERVEKVWRSLNDLYQKEKWHMQYFWLWRTAKKCRELAKDNCKLDTLFQNAEQHYLKPLESETRAFLESQGITLDGNLDKETQDIILSSYCGTRDPKIVRICYPVNHWQKAKRKVSKLWPF